MHYIDVKSILNRGWSGQGQSMNLYRGCTHGCIYCDSRANVYGMDHSFEDIAVKRNALELLEHALISKRKKCMIQTGSMSDPYMPIEDSLQYTRKSLNLIDKYGYGFSVITKSNHILNDLDLLVSMNEKSKVVVQMTLTVADDTLSKILEPNVCTTSERFEVLKVLRDHHIPTVVWLCPVLPFITDTKENIMSILDMCIEAKVYGIICFNMGMTLRDGNREYFYEMLDYHFPGYKQKYIQMYGNAYSLISPNHKTLMPMFEGICDKHGIVHDPDALFTYCSTFDEETKTTQLSLFDV